MGVCSLYTKLKNGGNERTFQWRFCGKSTASWFCLAVFTNRRWKIIKFPWIFSGQPNGCRQSVFWLPIRYSFMSTGYPIDIVLKLLPYTTCYGRKLLRNRHTNTTLEFAKIKKKSANCILVKQQLYLSLEVLLKYVLFKEKIVIWRKYHLREFNEIFVLCVNVISNRKMKNYMYY